MDNDEVITSESGFNTGMVDALAAAESDEFPEIAPSTELIDVDEPVNLTEMFHELETLTWSLADECREIDEIIGMMNEKRAVKEAEYIPKMQELEKQIKAEIVKQAKPFKCMWGEATYRKGYERTSWDSKALAGYAAAHPEIEKFKKVAKVEPTVGITAKFTGAEL